MSKRRIRLVLGSLLLALIVLFVLQNTAPVPVRLLWWSFTTSRVVLILTLLGIGFIFGLASGGRRR